MAAPTPRRRRASTEKTRPSVFWLLGGIVVPFVGLIAKIEIEGEENLPEEGPFVLAPNHHSEIDPLLVAVAVWRMGRAPRFMAKESLFRVPVLGWALRATGMIPVARASSAAAAKQALDTARHLAERRAGVIVYPEGTLTRDPDLWPMRGKTGAARLALAGDIPLIPMAQWGAQQIMPRYGKFRLWPLRRRVRVRVGQPIALEEYRDRAAHPAAQAELTTRVMDEIAGLLSDLRGEPAPAARWEPGAHGQSETGRLE
ncbi:1-acyl-sn-glycerol-3-phosphate acyltransferase [Microbacterium sp. CIAB417]|uniref:lysophospholipid acyltransferase family protein n=1 Tax=Microbacterium sp. CIAB417 TaxID=2860287 RepID=UPI001FABEBB7|nr:lysophospholipid acyltransferase family protein [Microbacterium sp. CIAB417]